MHIKEFYHYHIDLILFVVVIINIKRSKIWYLEKQRVHIMEFYHYHIYFILFVEVIINIKRSKIWYLEETKSAYYGVLSISHLFNIIRGGYY